MCFSDCKEHDLTSKPHRLGAAHFFLNLQIAIQQREKQRQLRGELVRIEKDALRMFVQASVPCAREDAGDHTTTHSVVAKVKSAGTQRSISLSTNR